MCWTLTAAAVPAESFTGGVETPKTDIWATGCTIIQFLDGECGHRQTFTCSLTHDVGEPFEGQQLSQISHNVTHGETPKLPFGISEVGARGW